MRHRKTSPEMSPPPGEYSEESPLSAIQKHSAAISAKRTHTQRRDSSDVHFSSKRTSGTPQGCFGTAGGGGGAGTGTAMGSSPGGGVGERVSSGMTEETRRSARTSANAARVDPR